MPEREGPPASALLAFSADAVPVPFEMGRGDTWAAGDLVLKRTEDEVQASWVADLAAAIPQRGFRLARPVPTQDGRWVADGWSACVRVAGDHSTTRWPELLAAAAAFHEAISEVPKPAWIDRRLDRWSKADRVAWGEASADDLLGTTHVAALVSARRPVDQRSQLVHGDLVGNVLFADGLPPAIIDLSLYWRPVGYSAALVAGDALTWEGASRDILRFIDHFAQWPQLLLRAVLFRIVVNELARRGEPGRADLGAEYVPVVDLVLSLVGRG